jgi:spore coat protein CotH
MVMVIKAIVNKSDYDNMVRTYYLKEDIDADLEVDGTLYKKGEIAFRGTSSLNFPKKGFKIKFRKKKLFQDTTKRFDLSASYVDKSLIRERLSFDLFAKTSVVASKAWPIDLIILSKEGQLLERGLYTGIEHVDKYFFRNRQREIGTLYKADGGTVNGQFMGAVLDPQPEAVLKILYDKKNTKKIVAQGFMVNLFRTAFNLPPIEIAEADEEDYSDLDRFTRDIQGWNAGTVAQHLPGLLDVDSYLDWLVVNTLLQSNDTYHKNYFLHNRVEDDKWEIRA